jgi:pullulanase
MDIQNKMIHALIDSVDTVSVYFEKNIETEDISGLYLYSSKKEIPYTVKYICGTRLILKVANVDVKKAYFLSNGAQEMQLIPHGVLDSVKYRYPGEDLGAVYSPRATTFKVFAPTAQKITVNIYSAAVGGTPTAYQMTEGDYGVWSVTVKENLKGKFYAFNVFGEYPEFQGKKDVVDPYAKCVIGKTGRAMVINEKSYGKKEPLKTNVPISSSVVYEIHMRDISISEDAGTNCHGKYLALTQDKTAYQEKAVKGKKAAKVSTLLSHIKELGVNTVQIMPIQDFDNDESDENEYGWGYMPRYFNSPDGIYSANWKDDSKIREVRKMVASLHKNGLRAILDVVYNHTAEGFYGEGIYSFNAFVPYFYYRFGNGYISNGSGCGNELRSEAPMVRKFIIETLRFWTDFYDFDGFRFDLMGLIDLETMCEIVKELSAIKPDIFIYGEPWTGGLTPIAPTYKGAQRCNSFSAFNDDFRDAIKGAVFDVREYGFIQSSGNVHRERIIQGILGSINTFAAVPCETMNYVEVHDNNTLFDKLYYSLRNTTEFGELDKDRPDDAQLLETIKAQHKLAAFILLTSQGVPVLHLGQDFMRTKHGVENSYNSPDKINAVVWKRKMEFIDVFNYYKNLIDLRKQNPVFSLPLDVDVRKAIEFRSDVFLPDNQNAIGYTLETDEKTLFVVINPYQYDISVNLKEDGWKMLLFGDDYFPEAPLSLHSSCVTVPRLSGAVFVKECKK